MALSPGLAPASPQWTELSAPTLPPSSPAPASPSAYPPPVLEELRPPPSTYTPRPDHQPPREATPAHGAPEAPSPGGVRPAAGQPDPLPAADGGCRHRRSTARSARPWCRGDSHVRGVASVDRRWSIHGERQYRRCLRNTPGKTTIGGEYPPTLRCQST